MKELKASETTKRVILAAITVAVAAILAEVSFYIRSRSEGGDDDYRREPPRQVNPQEYPWG